MIKKTRLFGSGSFLEFFVYRQSFGLDHKALLFSLIWLLPVYDLPLLQQVIMLHFIDIELKETEDCLNDRSYTES